MKKLTGKVNAVFSESVLLNIGKEESLAVPTAAFKKTPEKYQLVDFSVDAIGHKVKKDQSGKVVFRSKNIYASGFKVEKLHDTGFEIEAMDESMDAVDYNEPV